MRNTHQTPATTSPRPPQATNDRPTVSQAIKDEISAYVRSGGLDPFPCTLIAMEQVARRFGLTFRQTEELFIQYA